MCFYSSVLYNDVHVEWHDFSWLIFFSDGEHFFIDSDTKLAKIAPSHWRNPKGRGHTAIFTVFFRVKFYIDNVGNLK